VADRLPWTNISYADAQAACVAAGARLCTRAEWFGACACGGTGPDDYEWSEGGSCTATATTSSCNFDSDANGMSNPIWATGSVNTCNVGGVYDLNGNVKELTYLQDGQIMVRGGAYNNFAKGSACGFEGSFWPQDAPFGNVGFRCCTGPEPYFPPDQPAGDCGSLVEPETGHFYYRCSTGRTWSEARSLCQSVGMDLVRIDDQLENDFVEGLLGSDNAWIGANDRSSEGVWVWPDGEQFWQGDDNGNVVNNLYQNWNGGEPNDSNGEDCAEMRDNDGFWNDNDCGNDRDVVCESVN
jgi:hypothetical protein